MEDVARKPVSLPKSNPTKSYWQTPESRLAHHRSTSALPQNTDYAIIGSGISGASIAHFLQARFPNASLLMLEARTTCSGATGRNGGHTKGASYRTWGTEGRALGRDEADRIARLEWANVTEQRALAETLGIACDIRATRTVDIIYDAEQLQHARDTTAAMNAQVSGDLERYVMLEGDEARAKWHCPEALGAVEYEAGSVSGYKLVNGILERCLDHGLNLQTETPVTKLEQITDGSWRVYTERGVVAARQVVLATNGYTAAILPEMQGTIVPLRGQISVQRPGNSLPHPLPGTYTFSYAAGYEYMIPRPQDSDGEGDIVIGGGWATLPDEGVSEFGETDDAVLNADVSTYLKDATRRYFGEQNWGDDASEGRIKAEWTGIMGTSADGIPYVGEMPGKQGLWMSVSFNGHGMAFCFKCAAALVDMMTRDQAVLSNLDQWFPRSFKVRNERLGIKFEGRRNQKPQKDLPAPTKPKDALEGREQLLL